MNIDIVFFTWLDAFLSAYLMPFILDFFFSYDWSGLYMHPRYMRDMPELQYKKPGISDVDVLLTWRRCKNIAVHDEGIVSLLRMRLGKGVVLFPETADDAKPDPDYIPSVEIKQKSKERVIVTIAGVLERMKGFLYMIRLAKKANSDQFYFVFAGPMSIKDFNEIEQKEIQDFIFSKPENCYFHFHFIPEGKEFNAFINGSDIIFIVYENFASSSNRLTKAAIFKKLVLAQNRFCVGEDVLKYNLGITVEEGNIEQMEEALMKLRDKIKRNDYPLMEFEEYRELHGEAMLKVRFKEIFNFDN